MEIDVVRKAQENHQSMDRRQGLDHELVERAEAIFAPHVFDPTREKAKLQEVMEFVIQDCGAGSPDQLLELMQRIDRVTRHQNPEHDLLDRVWILAQTTRARNAQRALQRGP